MPESISQFYKRIQLRPSQPDAIYSKEKPTLIFSPGNVILEQWNSVTECFIREGIEP